MQESNTSVALPADPQHEPLHDDIAQCAKELWTHYGKPADRDLAIWLEAEHKLHSVTQNSRATKSSSSSSSARSTARHART